MTTKPEILAVQETDDDEVEGPFDPNRVRTRLWMPTVAHVLNRIQHGDIDLSAQWRHQSNVWTDAAESCLIESVLVRLPLPSFYMVENDDGMLAVIDGLGRLLALKRFVVDNDLPLTGLEFR